MRFVPVVLALPLLASCASREPSPAHLDGANDPQKHPSLAHHDHHGPIHNIHAFKGVISGSGPEGDAAFDQLASLGVKTIISVDGAAPDVERATVRGMRYVHVPVTYATITDEQRLEIARAIRDLPGPVFVHCHHGKHRGPAAVAAAVMTLGQTTDTDAVEYMVRAGTAASYTGLYTCVREAWVADDATLDEVPDDFPSVRRPVGIVAAMVEVDLAAEHLLLIKGAGWRVPADQPDLVPAAEAGRLADSMRISLEDPKVTDPDLIAQLREAVRLATALEEAIVAGEPAESISMKHQAVAASCKSCHKVHRD